MSAFQATYLIVKKNVSSWVAPEAHACSLSPWDVERDELP